MVLFSRIVSYAGLAVAWAGMWISTNTAAALVLTGGTLLLIAGAVVVGLRRKRAAGGVTPEAAERAYQAVRQSFLLNRLAGPAICVPILIYLDSELGRALIVGGLLVATFAGIPAERAALEKLRTQAEDLRHASA